MGGPLLIFPVPVCGVNRSQKLRIDFHINENFKNLPLRNLNSHSGPSFLLDVQHWLVELYQGYLTFNPRVKIGYPLGLGLFYSQSLVCCIG